jgi:hypothetical protein
MQIETIYYLSILLTVLSTVIFALLEAFHRQSIPEQQLENVVNPVYVYGKYTSIIIFCILAIIGSIKYLVKSNG